MNDELSFKNITTIWNLVYEMQLNLRQLGPAYVDDVDIVW